MAEGIAIMYIQLGLVFHIKWFHETYCLQFKISTILGWVGWGGGRGKNLDVRKRCGPARQYTLFGQKTWVGVCEEYDVPDHIE